MAVEANLTVRPDAFADTKDKTAAEKLQGYWIIEIGELAGMRKTEIETLKGF